MHRVDSLPSATKIPMNNIDPIWQSDDESVPVTVKSQTEPEITPSTGTQISRRPAAIVGMLLVIGAGFSFFRGVEGLTGQLIDGAQVIRITSEGFEPRRVEVEHGQTITWKNEAEVAHIIESDTLCSDTGFCLMTSTLLTGDSDNFTLTPDMQPGNYPYFSSIEEELIGEIIIVTQTADDFIDINEVVGNDFFAEPVGTTTPPPANADGFGPPQDFGPLPPSDTGLPTNPYAIGSERIHPFDGSGNPIPEAFGDEPDGSTSNVVASAIAQGRGPLRQPETGAGVWGVIFGSIAGLYWMTRNAFAKTS